MEKCFAKCNGFVTKRFFRTKKDGNNACIDVTNFGLMKTLWKQASKVLWKPNLVWRFKFYRDYKTGSIIINKDVFYFQQKSANCRVCK